MNYIEMVNDAIQYIESNLYRKLSLEELASRYYISPMHFYRIFRAATNQTVKSYILARKLSAAAIALRTSNTHNYTTSSAVTAVTCLAFVVFTV